MTLKGLAQAWGDQSDRDLLKSDWWYNWQVGDLSDPAYVPMLRSGLPDANLPMDYSGYCLVFNEPNLPEPNGCNLPDYMVGIARYAVLAHLYPDAKFIVGGVSSWKWGWLVRFHKMAVRCKLRLPAGYAIHGYANDYGTLPHMLGWWKAAHDQIKAITATSEFWVTETSDLKGNPATLMAILAKIKVYKFERFAVYTNRQPEGAGWAINKAVEMVNEDGLTPMGITFVEA
jgi:hypothetical protein